MAETSAQLEGEALREYLAEVHSLPEFIVPATSPDGSESDLYQIHAKDAASASSQVSELLAAEAPDLHPETFNALRTDWVVGRAVPVEEWPTP